MLSRSVSGWRRAGQMRCGLQAGLEPASVSWCFPSLHLPLLEPALAQSPDAAKRQSQERSFSSILTSLPRPLQRSACPGRQSASCSPIWRPRQPRVLDMILGDMPDGPNRQGKFAVGGSCVMASFNHRPPPVQLEQRREGNKNTKRQAQVLSGM